MMRWVRVLMPRLNGDRKLGNLTNSVHPKTVEKNRYVPSARYPVLKCDFKNGINDQIDSDCRGFFSREKVEKVAELLQNKKLSIRRVCAMVGVHRNTAIRIKNYLETGIIASVKNPILKGTGLISKTSGGKLYCGQWPVQTGEIAGICACGCGGRTTQAQYDDPKS